MPSRRTPALIILLASALLLGPIPTHAQDATFRVGLKSIAISAPTSELAETGSDYRVLLDILTPTNNRLVAAFLFPDELKAIQTGSSKLSRYALVEVPRRAEFATFTPEDFKQLSDSVAQKFGASLDASLKDQQDEINRRLKVLSGGPTTVTLDKPLMLGAFFSKPDACGVGSVMPIEVDGKTTKMVMALSIVRVQQRVLFAYLYTTYIDESSVTWARATSEKWADAILAANK